jgi:putative phosphoribosyl transferase
MENDDILFSDRREAGQMLGAELVNQGVKCDAVLGLTRGGVPVALEVAAALGAPMDVLVVKKLRAPFSEELAIGAICADGARVLREDAIRELEVPKSYLDAEIQARLAEAKALEDTYHGEHPALDLSGASVIVVDDGIATGATVEAGVLSARNRGASAVTVATPVGSEAACEALRRVADRVICMTRPVEFWAVGQFYLRFPQVSDAEVIRLLDESRATKAAASSRD